MKIAFRQDLLMPFFAPFTSLAMCSIRFTEDTYGSVTHHRVCRAAADKRPIGLRNVEGLALILSVRFDGECIDVEFLHSRMGLPSPSHLTWEIEPHPGAYFVRLYNNDNTSSNQTYLEELT